MARVEFLIGSEGPYFIEDTSPLWNDPRQVLRNNDVTDVLRSSHIVDDLTTNNATKVLSAKQGKVLKDEQGTTPIRYITEASTLTVADGTVLCSGEIAITLPDVASCVGRIFKIKKIDIEGTVVTITDLIDEQSTTLTLQYEILTVQSDGTKWWKI